MAEGEVYHSSARQGLTEITPSRSSHDQEYVYASKDRDLSVAFLGRKGGGFSCTIGREGTTGKPYICERRIGGFDWRYGNLKGSIYVLPSGGFESQKTDWSDEVVSEKPVKPTEEIKIEDVKEYLLSLERQGKVLIYRYPDRPSFIPKDDGDLVQHAVAFAKRKGSRVLADVAQYQPTLLRRVVTKLEPEEPLALKRTEITDTDLIKIAHDLRFLDLISKKAKELACRAVVSGGYAVDGALGRLTRPHNDIDIIVYSQSNNPQETLNKILRAIKERDESLEALEVIDKGRGEFYHTFLIRKKGFGADIYFVQTVANPFLEEKTVIKKDGSLTEPQLFEVQKATLLGVTFEVQDPAAELADKKFKKARGDKPDPKYNQDIDNLELILKRD